MTVKFIVAVAFSVQKQMQMLPNRQMLNASKLNTSKQKGVIVYWRGVWSLLDYALGDSPIADAACIAGGLLAVVGVRLSGRQVSDSFF
jgi:hypothetical protein